MVLDMTCMLFLLRSRVEREVRGEKSSDDLATDFRPLLARGRV